nr:OmpA family protein [uncultured Bdellovibrio sp.]
MKTLILVALISVGSLASANQQTPTTSALEFSREEAERAPEGLVPFIALGGGYTGYENVSSAEGTPATLKLLGSYYFPASHFVMDLGYGVNNQQFTQSRDTTLDTSRTGGALELAARYRWDSKWQAGIVANQFYEQGKALSADQGDAHFVGLQVLREFNMTPSWLARLGVRAMSLTNNTDGLVPMYLVDLQIGWNPGAYRTSVRQTAANENPVQREPQNVTNVDEESATSEEMANEEVSTPPSRPVAEVQPQSALRDVALSSVLGSGSEIQFNTAKASVSTEDQEKLSKVAKALADNRDLFEKVEIHGYADASGSPAINQRISQQRADSVRNIMRQNGLRSSDVIAKGMGSEDSTGVQASDRRAELVFTGVKDEAKLREVLSQIE